MVQADIFAHSKLQDWYRNRTMFPVDRGQHNMVNKILERIEREAGIPGLAALLAERLSATDLQSLLLEVYRQRAQRQPAAVLADYERNRFVRPSKAAPGALLEWEQTAFAN